MKEPRIQKFRRGANAPHWKEKGVEADPLRRKEERKEERKRYESKTRIQKIRRGATRRIRKRKRKALKPILRVGKKKERKKGWVCDDMKAKRGCREFAAALRVALERERKERL